MSLSDSTVHCSLVVVSAVVVVVVVVVSSVMWNRSYTSSFSFICLSWVTSLKVGSRGQVARCLGMHADRVSVVV